MQDKDEQEPITSGMAAASTVDLIRHSLTILVGIILSRLLKHNLLSSEEVSLLLGFLPSVLFSVGHAFWKRYQTRMNIAVALKMPEGSSIQELKAALSTDVPTAILSADENEVVLVKEVEKEEIT